VTATPVHLFVNTVTITPRTAGVDAMGGATLTDGLPTSGVRCNIQPRAASEALLNERPTFIRQAVGYFAPASAPGPNDLVTDEDGVKWKVKGMPLDQAGRGVVVRVELEEER
jgi:hypothetical protein